MELKEQLRYLHTTNFPFIRIAVTNNLINSLSISNGKYNQQNNFNIRAFIDDFKRPIRKYKFIFAIARPKIEDVFSEIQLFDEIEQLEIFSVKRLSYSKTKIENDGILGWNFEIVDIDELSYSIIDKDTFNKKILDIDKSLYNSYLDIITTIKNKEVLIYEDY